jgi:hypothetical protein
MIAVLLIFVVTGSSLRFSAAKLWRMAELALLVTNRSGVQVPVNNSSGMGRR